MKNIMNDKKPKIKNPLSTIAFVDKETNSLIITIHGFKDFGIAEEFAEYMLCRSGMDYEPANDLFKTLPTIH